MHLSPDQTIFWQYGFLKLNATILFTWALMIVLAVRDHVATAAYAVRRGLLRLKPVGLLLRLTSRSHP